MPDDKKQLLIAGIEQMRISMVDVLLPQNRLYMDVERECWLQKLEELFLECKRHGDTHLIYQTGRCAGDGCRHNGCNGMSFTGNNSGMGFDLMLTEGDNGEIDDIFECCVMELGTDTSRRKTLYLDIMEDDKAGFIPSPSFIEKSNLCRQALEELDIYRHTLILEETWVTWLLRHRELFRSFILPPFEYRDFVDFHRMYNNLKNLRDMRKYTDASLSALNALLVMDPEDVKSDIKWLLHYYRMWTDICLPLEYNIQLHSTVSLPEINYSGFRFSAENIVPVYRFYHLFEIWHWQMFADDRTYRKRINKLNKQTGIYRF